MRWSRNLTWILSFRMPWKLIQSFCIAMKTSNWLMTIFMLQLKQSQVSSESWENQTKLFALPIQWWWGALTIGKPADYVLLLRNRLLQIVTATKDLCVLVVTETDANGSGYNAQISLIKRLQMRKKSCWSDSLKMLKKLSTVNETGTSRLMRKRKTRLKHNPNSSSPCQAEPQRWSKDNEIFVWNKLFWVINYVIYVKLYDIFTWPSRALFLNPSRALFLNPSRALLPSFFSHVTTALAPFFDHVTQSQQLSPGLPRTCRA